METDKYLEAARIVAECKPSKLPYVLNLLKQAGIEVAPETVKAARMNARSRDDYAKRMREEKGRADWTETTNPTSLHLRELYDEGKSIMQIARASGVNKSCLYLYIRGKRNPNVATAEIIEQTIKELYG